MRNTIQYNTIQYNETFCSKHVPWNHARKKKKLTNSVTFTIQYNERYNTKQYNKMRNFF